MLLPTLLLPLALISSVSAGVNLASYKGKSTSSSSIVPNRYIVEFSSASGLSGVGKRDSDVHDHLRALFEPRAIGYSVAQTYNSDVFIGASINIKNTTDILTVAAIPGIINIFPVHSVPRPTVFKSDFTFATSTTRASAAKRAARRDAVAPLTNKKRTGAERLAQRAKPTTTTTTKGKTTTATSATATPSVSAGVKLAVGVVRPSSANAMAGVDKLQASGLSGKGIKIGVIDSGVDYNHPALGGGFGAGFKIAGGYDYVGDNFDGDAANIAEDNDPYDNCDGHGTFIAGIIGADAPNMYNVTGVSPQASQYHYRVYSCYGLTTDDIIAKAMQDAYTQGMDIINLSLGEFSSWSETMLSVVASRIAATGVVVAAVSGNDGLDGAFYTESPGSGDGVWAIGSVDNAVYASQLANVTGLGDITYLRYRAFPTGTYPLFAYTTTYPSTNDACPIPAALAGQDLSEVVVVVQVGTACSNDDQLNNLANAGAVNVLQINTAGTPYVYGGRFAFNYAQVSPSEGKAILALIAAGQNPTITFDFRPTAVANNDTGGYTSSFSSIGPTNDMLMKPQFNAPGGLIISTLPVDFGAYAQASGTSWSCPFGVGVAALQMESLGGRSKSGGQQALLSAIQATANPEFVSPADQSIQSTSSQGAGLIYAFDAVKATTVITPTELLLNDTANYNGIQTITIKNTGTSSVTYTLSHSAAQTVYNFQQGSYESEYGPNLPAASRQATVIILPPFITLGAGKSAKAIITVIPPLGLTAARLPIYSGFVNVKSSAANFQIPYLGVAAALKDIPVLDSTSATGTKLPAVLDSNGAVQTAATTYTLANGDAPTVLYRLLAGTPVILIDLVKSNANLGFNPTITKRGGFFGLKWLTWWSNNNNKSTTFGKVPIIGNVFENDYVSRNSGYNPAYDDGNQVNSFAFSGTFSNGTTVPNGSYKFLIRAQRIATDPSNQANYDSWVSPVFTVAA